MPTLYNVYLPSFKAAVDAGVATFMVSFNEINGVPSSGNEYLVRGILKNKWDFQGFVVSDWGSVEEMIDHGFAANGKEAAELAITAGVDMEMATTTYLQHLKGMIEEGEIDEKLLDEAVRRILKVKFQLGLFEAPYVKDTVSFDVLEPGHLDIAREAAVQSLVLLKNERRILPLSRDIKKVFVCGPLADEAYEQLGTWIFDGERKHSVTPLHAINDMLGADRVLFDKILTYSRDKDESGFPSAIVMAKQAGAVIAIVGEESILSGEAHSRADITLPGKQAELLKTLKSSGKPVIMVVMAGRPLAMKNVEDYCDAILYAWHPGTMGGIAVAEVLFGERNPSGKLPVSFPLVSGQEPLYYNHKRTGRPPSSEKFVSIDDMPVNARQFSFGNTSNYMDAGYEPAYPFGYGLSYTTFDYSGLTLDRKVLTKKDTLHISVEVMNTGEREGTEIVQLYIRDQVGSLTRPVKELKRFQRVFLNPGEKKTLAFFLTYPDLGFYNNNFQWKVEPGDFTLFVGGSSVDCLEERFSIE
jgi:beta-glucosidase